MAEPDSTGPAKQTSIGISGAFEDVDTRIEAWEKSVSRRVRSRLAAFVSLAVFLGTFVAGVVFRVIDEDSATVPLLWIGLITLALVAAGAYLCVELLRGQSRLMASIETVGHYELVRKAHLDAYEIAERDLGHDASVCARCLVVESLVTSTIPSLLRAVPSLDRE